MFSLLKVLALVTFGLNSTSSLSGDNVDLRFGTQFRTNCTSSSIGRATDS
jgi:hypothetical protein